MLVRASSRHGELALMAAVGAGRHRLLRDAALESVMLAIAGGALGVWLASGLLDVILSLAPEQMRILSRASGGLDLRAVVFALAATAATSITFGILPAWRVSRVDPLDALKQQSRSAAGSRDDWWQGALVSIQITLVVVLLAGAGLLLRSFVKLNQVDLGFAPDGLALVELQMTAPPYAAPNAALNFAREVERRVESQMAMKATVITASPVRGGGFHVEAVPEAEGLTPPPGTIELPASRISPDFFDVFQIPMIEGRTFLPEDGDHAVIVNDVLARRYWGEVSPIGRRFRADTDTPWLTVVGVSSDVKHFGPADPMGGGMEIYQPYPANSRSNNFLTIAVAAGDRPEAALPLMKRIIWDIDPRMPIPTALTLNQQLGGTLARPRFILTLAGAFTICAALIAAVGVYGVSSYWVLRRRRELAIRLAIGASPDRLVWSVLKRSLVLSAIGIAAGLAITFAGARVMTSLLFATDPRDPLTLVAVTIALGLIAVVACAGPAFRAARVDPMTTLRAE
jgi:predicted permease